MFQSLLRFSRSSPRAFGARARVLLLTLCVPTAASAHFPFSYSAVESVGLVQSAFPPVFGIVTVGIDFTPRTEHDYLRLQPLVAGHAWHYRGTINNTRTTLPAELVVEVLSAQRSGEGPSLVVEYTVRHTVTFGAVSAATTITGLVTSQGDRVLKIETVPAAPNLPRLERTFADGGLLGMPRRLMEFRSGRQAWFARLAEVVSGVRTDGVGGRMEVEVRHVGNVSTELGAFQTLTVAQWLSFGTVTTPPFISARPPAIEVISDYALDVGPVRIAWTQAEPLRETVRGVLQLVRTNFPATPQPLRQPQVFAHPEPCAIEPGATLSLAADVIGVVPGDRMIVVPSPTPLTNSAGTEFRWTTPRGVRWTLLPALRLENVTLADAGDYELEVVTATGTARSATARVTITPPASRSRVINVASRAPGGRASDTIIAGIVLSPSDTPAATTRPLLFRAVGPALRSFGVNDAEADPVLVVYDSANREVARCDDWNASPDSGSRVATATNLIGTFPFAPGSRDAALVLDLAPGNYTAHLLSSGAGSPSVGLIEIYDAGAREPGGPRIVNLSTRSRIGLGDEILIPGIVVTEGSARLLIRALGPSLARFGVEGALPDPEITLYAAGTPIAYNDDWSVQPARAETLGDSASQQPSVARAIELAGASELRAGALDAALVATLPPGSYTLQVRSREPRQTGIVVAEVFLLNP